MLMKSTDLTSDKSTEQTKNLHNKIFSGIQKRHEKKNFHDHNFSFWKIIFLMHWRRSEIVWISSILWFMCKNFASRKKVYIKIRTILEKFIKNINEWEAESAEKVFFLLSYFCLSLHNKLSILNCWSERERFLALTSYNVK